MFRVVARGARAELGRGTLGPDHRREVEREIGACRSPVLLRLQL